MLSERAAAVMACRKCHASLTFTGDTAVCTACSSRMALRDGVVMAKEGSSPSYFDAVFEVMKKGNREPGTWELFYRRQAELVSSMLHKEAIVVDVGCGPEIPYDKRGAYVIGIDASVESIRANNAVDLKVFASAAELPLKSDSIDKVMCFYSIHHMTGATITEHKGIVQAVFREFGRVLAPGGSLLIFDVSPRWPFGTVQEISWPFFRRRLGADLDMYFWRAADLEALGRDALPGSAFALTRFEGSLFTTFPPIFNVPALRLPRLFYPFDICMYEWRKALAADGSSSNPAIAAAA